MDTRLLQTIAKLGICNSNVESGQVEVSEDDCVDVRNRGSALAMSPRQAGNLQCMWSRPQRKLDRHHEVVAGWCHYLQLSVRWPAQHVGGSGWLTG